MAAPYVDSRTQSRVNTAGTSHTAALPAQTAGGLLLTLSSFSGAGAVTPPAESTGWKVLANEVYDAGLTPERRIFMAQVRGNSAVGAPIFTSADATLSAHVSWQILGHTVSNPATDIIVGSSLAGAMPAVAPAFSIPAAKDCLVLAVGSASTPSGGVTGNTSNTGYTQFRTYSTTTTSAAGSQVWAAEFTPASGTSSVPAASFPSGLSATLGMHIAIPGTGPSTMLGAYGFNEGMGASAADSSGLTALGPMTPKASDMPTWPAGKTLTGVQMTATGDAFYAFGVDPVPNIFARTFTLMFWAGDYGSQSVFAVCYGRAAGASAWDNVQYLRWHPQFNTANAQFFGQDAWNDNQVVFTDGWAHLALTFDLTNGLRLYANGTLIRSVPYSSLTFPSTFAQGASRIGLVRGRIDDLRLFDSALTATQIQAYRDDGIGSSSGGPASVTVPAATGSSAPASAAPSVPANTAAPVIAGGTESRPAATTAAATGNAPTVTSATSVPPPRAAAASVVGLPAAASSTAAAAPAVTAAAVPLAPATNGSGSVPPPTVTAAVVVAVPAVGGSGSARTADASAAAQVVAVAVAAAGSGDVRPATLAASAAAIASAVTGAGASFPAVVTVAGVAVAAAVAVTGSGSPLPPAVRAAASTTGPAATFAGAPLAAAASGEAATSAAAVSAAGLATPATPRAAVVVVTTHVDGAGTVLAVVVFTAGTAPDLPAVRTLVGTAIHRTLDGAAVHRTLTAAADHRTLEGSLP